MIIRDILANNLKKYREEAGLTVYEVGEAVGKSGKTVSAWESGRGQPDADMLIVLCRLYKIKSISDLYGEEDEFVRSLSIDEKRLVSAYRKLNVEGKSRLNERAEELVTLGFSQSEKGDFEKMA